MLRTFVVRAALVLLGLSVSSARSWACTPPEEERGVSQDTPVAAAPNPSLIEEESRQQALMSQLIEREVQTTLARARQTVSVDPEQARRDLKTTLHVVIVAPELRADVRSALRGQLESALRSTERQLHEYEARVIERQASQAAAAERARVVADLANQQERTRQLVDRFESLLAEGREELADEVAAEIQQQAPGGPVAISTQTNVRLGTATRQALETRVARQKGVVDTLHSSEQTDVPQSDELPVRYPAAEVWQELTVRRYHATHNDLRKATPSEARVSKALLEPTSFDFVETPLTDVIDYLKDLHGIEIQFDTRSLEASSIGIDTPITRRLQGISLRSALRILLNSVDLTYTIENEVLTITTPERAAERVVTRVYPVGDLVIPVRTPTFTGGFGTMGNFGQGQNSGMGNAGGPGRGQNPFGNFGQGNNGLGQMPF